MFIRLDELYYDVYTHGWLTRKLAVNVDEISDFHEKDLVEMNNGVGVELSLKNGNSYFVCETYKEILKKIEAKTEERKNGKECKKS